MPGREMTPEEFRRAGHRVVDWVADYRERLASRPVAAPVRPGAVRAALPADVPEVGEELDGLLADLDAVVVPALVHWQHPSFFGYFPANASLPSVLGELLSAGLGVQGMLWSTSPAATEVEQLVTDQLAGLLGLGPEWTHPGGGGGVIQDSASSAALVAVLTALHRSGGGAWRESGVDGSETVYVSPDTHSSLAKAVRVAGLGERALRVVDVDPVSRAMRPDALAARLASDVDAGRRPVLVCATVGTTSTGAVDPVAEIATLIAERCRGVWLHVDAAWAGAAAACPELRGPFAGVEHADSFCADAHKWLLTAFDASVLWTRHPGALVDALGITPEYLRNAASESGAVVDYRDWHVPLGRRFRALKLWAVLRSYGVEGLRGHVRRHVAWAGELAEAVRTDPRFELAAPPSFALVCLRVRTGRGVAADDAATRAVLERVNASGRALLTHTVVDGRYLLRVAVGSVATRREDVQALWTRLQAAAGG